MSTFKPSKLRKVTEYFAAFLGVGLMASIFAWATGADVMQVLAAGLGATLFIVGMTALLTLGAVLR